MIETIALRVGGLASAPLITGYAADVAILLAMPSQTPD